MIMHKREEELQTLETPKNCIASMAGKRFCLTIIDGLRIAKGVELDEANTNTIQAIAYNDVGNTDPATHHNITLHTDPAQIYHNYDSKWRLRARAGAHRLNMMLRHTV